MKEKDDKNGREKDSGEGYIEGGEGAREIKQEIERVRTKERGERDRERQSERV